MPACAEGLGPNYFIKYSHGTHGLDDFTAILQAKTLRFGEDKQFAKGHEARKWRGEQKLGGHRQPPGNRRVSGKVMPAEWCFLPLWSSCTKESKNVLRPADVNSGERCFPKSSLSTSASLYSTIPKREPLLGGSRDRTRAAWLLWRPKSSSQVPRLERAPTFWNGLSYGCTKVGFLSPKTSASPARHHLKIVTNTS